MRRAWQWMRGQPWRLVAVALAGAVCLVAAFGLGTVFGPWASELPEPRSERRTEGGETAPATQASKDPATEDMNELLAASRELYARLAMDSAARNGLNPTLRAYWPSITVVMPEWVKLWSALVPGFGPDVFLGERLVPTRAVAGGEVRNLLQTPPKVEEWREALPQCAWSPDRKRCVDIYTQLGGPDTEARLLDPEAGTSTRLYFSGSCCLVTEAAWLDRRILALVVATRADPAGSLLRHEIFIYDLDRDQCAVYRGPLVAASEVADQLATYDRDLRRREALLGIRRPTG